MIQSVTRYPLPATRYPASFTRSPSPATRHLLPVTRYPSPVSRYPPPATCHPPPATRHPPPATGYEGHAISFLDGVTVCPKVSKHFDFQELKRAFAQGVNFCREQTKINQLLIEGFRVAQ